MKKIASSVVFLLLVLISLFMLSSCSQNNTPSQSQCQHQWQEATCIFPKTCRLCYQTEGEPLGHQFSDATCTKPSTCTLCGKTEGEAHGHRIVIDKAISATCTTEGLTEGKHCSVCNKILVEQTKIDISEHKYNNEICIYCNELSPKASQYNAGNDAYYSLKTAHELCVEAMDSIYGAWYFTIFDADDYYKLNSCLRAFCSKSNLSQNEVLSAIDTVLQSVGITNIDDDLRCAALQVPSYAIAIVNQVHRENGTNSLIEVNLTNAKSSLKTLTNEYSDFTGYSTLKSYYSEILAYTEFCQSPTGSFAQLKNTINTYETNLRNYQNNLSYIYE